MIQRRLIFTAVARTEVIDAIGWYERHAPTIVLRLRVELRAIVRRITDNPLQFPGGPGGTRRALVRHFPYFVIFRVAESTIQVVAFFHTSRDPEHLSPRQ